MGAEQYDKLKSACVILLMHMLKWDHQPERRSRSWANSVAEQRDRIEVVLRRNPGLKSRIAEAVSDGYRIGRLRASTETDRPLKAFPQSCPYDWDTITQREIDFRRGVSLISSPEPPERGA